MKKKILIGKFDNKFPRNLVLDEYINEKKSGSFYGNFTTGKEIEGEYISQSEPNNKLKFKLKEIDAPTEVAGPFEVTLEEWISLVDGMQINVRKDGKYHLFKFDQKTDAEQDFVKWNKEQDVSEQ